MNSRTPWEFACLGSLHWLRAIGGKNLALIRDFEYRHTRIMGSAGEAFASAWNKGTRLLSDRDHQYVVVKVARHMAVPSTHLPDEWHSDHPLGVWIPQDWMPICFE